MEEEKAEYIQLKVIQRSYRKLNDRNQTTGLMGTDHQRSVKQSMLELYFNLKIRTVPPLCREDRDCHHLTVNFNENAVMNA